MATTTTTATPPNEPPPLSLLIRNGMLLLLFLLPLALSLRLLFVIGPLRPPPLPRYRGGTATNGASSKAGPSTKNGSSPHPAHDDDDDDDDDDDRPPIPTLPPRQGHILIVLGSGGHTAEMLAMLSRLDAATFVRSWGRRTWVVGEGDEMSARRAREFEEGLARKLGWEEDGQMETEKKKKKEEEEEEGVRRRIVRGREDGGNGGGRDAGNGNGSTSTGTYALHPLPRARHIHQPLLTTPLTALHTLHKSLALLHACPPDIILTNGPATGTIVVLASVLLRLFALADLRGMRTVYVESWARVRRLSLSGRLLLGVRGVDRFLVQWEGLEGVTGGRGEFAGVLV